MNLLNIGRGLGLQPSSDFRLFKNKQDAIEEMELQKSCFPPYMWCIVEINPAYSESLFCVESYTLDLKKHKKPTAKFGEKRKAFTPEQAMEICRSENAQAVATFNSKIFGFAKINDDLAFIETYKTHNGHDGFHFGGL